MYRRELDKLHDTKSGQAAGTKHESKWQYLATISFANPVMIPRPTLSNVPAAEESVLRSTQQMFRLMIMTMMNSVKGVPMNAK
jgi:hypothetical protein